MIAPLWAGWRDGAVGPVRVDGRHLLWAGGTRAAVVRSSDFDLTALDEARRAAAVAAFARLCHTLDAHLQIVLQVRRWCDPARPGAEPAATAPDIAARLRAAEAEHRQASLRTRPAFRRTLLLVPSTEGDAADLDRAVEAVLAALAAAGAGAEVLEGEALAARVHDAWGGGAVGAGAQRFGRPAWQARPREASTGAVWVRGYRLRRLPGCAVEPGWLAPLLLTRAECDVAIHLDPTPVGEAVSRLSRRLRKAAKLGSRPNTAVSILIRGEHSVMQGISMFSFAGDRRRGGVDRRSTPRRGRGRGGRRPRPAGTPGAEPGALAAAQRHRRRPGGRPRRARPRRRGGAGRLRGHPGGVRARALPAPRRGDVRLAAGTRPPRRRQARRLRRRGDVRPLGRGGLRRPRRLPPRTLARDRRAGARRPLRHRPPRQREHRRPRRLRAGQELHPRRHRPRRGRARPGQRGHRPRGRARVADLRSRWRLPPARAGLRHRPQRLRDRRARRGRARPPRRGRRRRRRPRQRPASEAAAARRCSATAWSRSEPPRHGSQPCSPASAPARSASSSTAPPPCASTPRWRGSRCATSTTSSCRRRRCSSPSGSGRWSGRIGCSATWSSTRSGCSAPTPRCAACSPSSPAAAASTASPWWSPPRTPATCSPPRRAPSSPPTRRSSSSAATGAPRPLGCRVRMA